MNSLVSFSQTPKCHSKTFCFVAVHFLVFPSCLSNMTLYEDKQQENDVQRSSSSQNTQFDFAVWLGCNCLSVIALRSCLSVSTLTLSLHVCTVFVRVMPKCEIPSKYQEILRVTIYILSKNSPWHKWYFGTLTLYGSNVFNFLSWKPPFGEQLITTLRCEERP